MAGKGFKDAMSNAAGSSTAAKMIARSQGDPGQAGEQELKSRRLNLLLRPSVYSDIAKVATMERVSVNEIINRALEEYGNAHRDTVDAYGRTFGEEV